MHIQFNYMKILMLCHLTWLCAGREYGKYILVLGNYHTRANEMFQSGYDAFEGCLVKNCYATNNEGFFKESMARFDAVVFSGPDLPEKVHFDRYAHQKYIYLNLDPSKRHPICNRYYDNFFNWTATYKLDSDFIFTYMTIKNISGHTVGPRIEMNWIANMQDIDDESFVEALESKTKAVAWLASRCSQKHRNMYVYKLNEALLQNYNLSVDIFGKCGNKKCNRKSSECMNVLRKDYFFYLAFETVRVEDYVTDIILTAMQNYLVPIVNGGADYSRFLPPGSYLDTRIVTPESMAETIHRTIMYRKEYMDFFKWRRYYRYMGTSLKSGLYKGDAVCKICAALNDENQVRQEPAKTDLLSWWDPNYKKHCETHRKFEDEGT